MTLGAANTSEEHFIEVALLPVVAQSTQLCTSLLVNTLRRAFARCAAFEDLLEPDWYVWTTAIINDGNFPATHLLQPGKHIGYALLQGHVFEPKEEVLRHYRRAFHSELMMHQAIYEEYFKLNHVPDFIREALWARGQLEELLRALEVLQDTGGAVRRKVEQGTIIPLRKSKSS